ncbi:uncharacterized protein EV422DRAFT_588375 [Fimicolochytrium jonesii]|uniref:uncharacterized protein n=1 Tax=Fimicolochytrium jonesii TaxID=1396493 RepID=UPI0022FEFC30|nr:uncharacterized protein EV422DRAFT_588375 [Fimicolochytrium jonesii]KAI8819570.1 hypothetical protein EV422DRAFT_588375 [Fimicolochytrium jonesii]
MSVANLALRLLQRLPAGHLSLSAEQGEQLVTRLLGARCCPRCVFRYLGVRDRTTHVNLLDLTKEWTSAKRSSESAVFPSVQARHLAEPKSELNTASLGKPDKVPETTSETPEGNDAGHQAKKAKVEKEDGTVLPVNTRTDQEFADEPSFAEEAAVAPEPTPSQICSACLGLLHHDHQAVAQKAYDMQRNENYELSATNQTFVLSMRLPTQLAIRQKSYVLYVRHLEQELGTSDVIFPDVEVKEVLRMLLANAYSQLSGLMFDQVSPFSVIVHLEHKETAQEYKFLTKIPEAGLKVKTTRQKGQIVVHGISFEKIIKAVEDLTYEHFASASMCPPPAVKTLPVVVGTELNHSQIYVAGRYLKLRRHISNSPWVIKGERLAEHSVEEFVAEKVDEFFRTDGHKFYSSGREDSDVLMLGKGRPYYLELLNPRRIDATKEEMKALEDAINEAAKGLVGARHMQIVTKEDTKELKDAANTKSKSYSTLVKLASPVTIEQLQELSKTTNLEVKQQNPTRVPRRADLLRDKLIETLHVYPASSADGPLSDTPTTTDEVRVDLRTSAGTYVKEFMHGDNGRTNPSLKDLLGVEWAKVLELDVLEVHLDWPRDE